VSTPGLQAAQQTEPPRPHIAPGFEPVARAFERLYTRGPGGGALAVRLRGETVIDLWGGTTDRRGVRRWTPETPALSFSTTKGVASTILHRLADRGELDYDEPVATYWPEFGVGGKDRISVRDLLTHRAGLHDVQAVVHRAEDLLDHVLMEERLAARPAAVTDRPAYHAITYGWLVAGLARRITGCGMAELARTEIAEPLQIEGGLHIGVPPGGPESIAQIVGTALRRVNTVGRFLGPLGSRLPVTRAALAALYVPGFGGIFEGSAAPVWQTEMPAVNGAFTANALARMYAALANRGADGGRRLLSPETTHELGRVQTRAADAVLGVRMRWRLGYHQAFGAGREASRAFGHYGYGGSGGWADPDLGLSLGFVTNKLGAWSSPMGDFSLFRLSAAVRKCAARQDGRA